jgi:hypothetical protein
MVPASTDCMAIDRLFQAGFEHPFGEPTETAHFLIRVSVCPTERMARLIGGEPFVERTPVDCRVDDFLIQLWWRDELVHLPPSRLILRRGVHWLKEHVVLRDGDVVSLELGRELPALRSQ